ncbi:MAG: Holliday junction branch migration protein RuvA [Puniceicoccales bacterium]|jgi:Holliday junction DNA helicase RuvA|nr:Holliday junction branch migration protein RuvA [Puniceicoccales bacterium]
MITSLHGTLLESGLFRAVIEAAGVGYEVHIPITTTEKLPPPGATLRLHTLQIIRENEHSLYGFATTEERDFFRLLIEKVSGIGPKTALNIFSRLSMPTLKDAIARGNVRLLSECPGIGKKTAERLIIELRDKLTPAASRPAAHAAPLTDPARDAPQPTLSADATAALVTLGFKPADADKAVRLALEKAPPGITLEKLIRAALGNPQT